MCLGVGLFGFLLIEILCASWICLTFSLIKLEKFSIITFFRQVFYPLLFFLSFWYPYYVDIIMFHVVLQLPYHLFIISEPLFLFFLFLGAFFSALSSGSLIQYSASSSLILIPSTVFFSSEIVFFISSWPLLILSISFFILT